MEIIEQTRHDTSCPGDAPVVDAARVGGSNNQNQHHSTTYPICVIVSINYGGIGVHTFLSWQEVCEL